MRRIPIGCFLAMCWLASTAAHATDGFYGGVRFQIDVSPGSDYGKTLLIQADGKLLLGGTCVPISAKVFCATRLRADGSYDSGFGPTGLGYVTFDEFPGFPSPASLRAAALAAGGGSVAVGEYYVGSTQFGVIAKLTSAGALDTATMGGIGWRTFSFSALPANPISIIEAIAVEADGKIVVVGSAKRNDQSNYDFGVMRFASDLSIDSSFGDGGSGVKLIAFDLGGPSGSVQDYALAIAIQPDGKIVVAGSADSGDSHGYRAAVVRLTTSGQLDADPVLGFGTGGKATFDWGISSQANAVTVDRDGSLLIAGHATGPTLSNGFVVSRLTRSGSLSSDFGPPCTTPPFCLLGTVYINFGYGGANYRYDIARAIALQSNGRIVVVGSADRSAIGFFFGEARLLRNGGLDPSFGSGGISGGTFGPDPGVDDTAYAVAIGNGGIMIAGESREAVGTKYRFGITRLQLDLIFTDGFQ